MRRNFFARKPLQSHFVDPDTEHPHTLKRHLGSFQLTVIGIGAIIGAGIFVITGKAAALYAGPAIVLSFLLAFIICVLAGLCYAELSAMIPIAGGSYSFSYAALGELPAWIIGWSVTGQYLIASSTVAVGWSGYFTSFLNDWGLHLPSSPFNLPAVLLVLLIGLTISIGIRTVAHFTSAMVAIKLGTVLVFILLGLGYVNPGNWTPFIPDNTGTFGEFGLSGIVRAAGLVFFAYIGFDTVSTLALDAKNPQKDLPRGILGSLFICTAAYIIVSFILTGIVPYSELNVADPIAVALNKMNLFWVSILIKIAILAGLASVVLVEMLAQTRLFLAIGKDGLLPPPFAKVNPRSRTPLFSTCITTLVAALLAGLFPVDMLGQLVSMMTLIIFSVVCLAVLILRSTHPEFPRPFKVPLVPYIPLLGILACLSQMIALPAITWLQTFIWLFLGFTIYLSYSHKHSKFR
jgi:APA family basic amino acid/polyamine antiporter